MLRDVEILKVTFRVLIRSCLVSFDVLLPTLMRSKAGRGSHSAATVLLLVFQGSGVLQMQLFLHVTLW
jgi:hypothetical protein